MIVKLKLLKDFIKHILKFNVSTTDKNLDSNLPYLVSFPRTGSHWLRMMLELYTDRPLLNRSFYKHKNKKYLLNHTHDLELNVKRKNIIYLYRSPVDVIYSQLMYHKQDLHDENLIVFWSNSYASHLIKWIYKEDYSEHKTIVTYERLKNNLDFEFKKLCNHLDLNFEYEKLVSVSNHVTKKRVSEKTKHDKQVINRNEEYKKRKEHFRSKYESFILTRFEEISELTMGDTTSLMKLFHEQ